MGWLYFFQFSPCFNRLFHSSFFVKIGIYFGKPRGFGKDENGVEIGFNTEVYAKYEVNL